MNTNTNTNTNRLDRVKVTLKINKINSYSDTCNIRDCNICEMDQEND